MIKINREELAWAAGFFDGEGCTYVRKREDGSSKLISIDIRQTLPSTTLYRFQRAVGGIGKVNGPYKANRSYWSDFFVYNVDGIERCQAVIVLLWYWLSEVKRNQYLISVNSYLEGYTPKDYTKFKCGHPRVSSNIYNKWDTKMNKNYPSCLECSRARARSQYYKNRVS